MRLTINFGRRAVTLFTLLILLTVLALSARAQDGGQTTAQTEMPEPTMTTGLAARQKANGRIVYQSGRNGQEEIFLMDADGTNTKQLTNNTTDDIMPAWSPDGTKIAFVSFRDINAFPEIYVMNVDGGHVVRLTNNVSSDFDPAWSPNGTKILFRSYRDGNAEIYSMNPDGTAQTRLTTNPGDDTEPSWSPDGSRIIFTSVQNGNTDIYAMNPDGSGQTRLTTDPAVDKSPSWSPSGSIVFVSARFTGAELFLMNADGSNQTHMTYSFAGSQFDPEFSPDGKKITYVSNGMGEPEIFSVNSDFTNPVRLTNNPTYDTQPARQPLNVNGKLTFTSNRNGNPEIYSVRPDGLKLTNVSNSSATDELSAASPDGTKIAFQSFRESNWDIYVMDADGANVKRLTTDAANDTTPAWSADGSKLAFTSKRDGNPEVYVMNADGTNQTRVTNNTAEDSNPSWSLSGTQLAFQSDRDGQLEIFVFDLDTLAETKLTGGQHGSRPKWSPDGSRIAFMSSRDGNLEVYVMDAAGGNPKNLTNMTGSDVDPAWSPDGTKLAFSSIRDGNWEIYTIKADGSDPVRMTQDGASDEEPAWKTVGTYFISGRVAVAGVALKDVVVSLQRPGISAFGAVSEEEPSPTSGELLLVTSTNENGVFAFNSLAEDSSYVVTFSKTNYTFTPAERAFYEMNGSRFITVAAALTPYVISGRITDGPNGLAAVSVKLTGSKFVTQLTDGNGNYSFTVPAGGNYIVTPTLVNYIFVPTSRTYSNLSGNQVYQDFAATAKTYTVGGVIKMGTAALPGVTVTLSSPLPTNFVPRTTMTTITGSYTFSNVPAGRNYIVTPAKANYTFTPATRTYSALSANQTAANFAATLKTYNITGAVTLAGSTTGLSQVTVKVTSPQAGFVPRAVLTNTAGVYTLTGLPAGRTYVVTPVKLNYNFTPASLTLLNLAANKEGQNFKAALKTYSITGLITKTGTTTAVPLVAVTITSATPAGFSPRTVQTNTTGIYTFTNLPAGRTYTIKPVKAGYVFTPLTKTVSNLSGNVPAGSMSNFSGTQ